MNIVELNLNELAAIAGGKKGGRANPVIPSPIAPIAPAASWTWGGVGKEVGKLFIASVSTLAAVNAFSLKSEKMIGVDKLGKNGVNIVGFGGAVVALTYAISRAVKISNGIWSW